MPGSVSLKTDEAEGPLTQLKNTSFKSKAGKNQGAEGKKASERLDEIKTGTQKTKEKTNPDITRKGLSGVTLAIQNTISETGKGGKLKTSA
jgi:uncharacterized protein YpuA (DUF1002 family)